jgi:hypothetical protein
MDEPEQEDLDRTDLASTGVGFLAWLEDKAAADADAMGPFSPLYFMTSAPGFPMSYSFDAYSDTVRSISGDTDETVELIELLLVAEAEWRVDALAKTKSRAALGLLPSGRGVTGLPGDPKRKARPPVLKCEFTRRDGSRCGRHVVPGSPRCDDHGGALVSPEVRMSILVSAYTKLVEGADTAVAALISVAATGTNELARVQAAKEILDRVGMGAEQTITIKTAEEDTDSRLEAARDKLNDVRERIISDPRYRDAIEAEIAGHSPVAAVSPSGAVVAELEPDPASG